MTIESQPLNMTYANLTLRSGVATHRCLVCMKDPQLIHELSPRTYKSNYIKKKEIKQR